MDYKHVAKLISEVAEFAGVAIIALGIIVATVTFIIRVIKVKSAREQYKPFRQDIGRSVVLGLELMVAGDIIRFVAMPSQSFERVATLVTIILIRAVLAVQLEMEIQGKWPWREKPS